MANNLIRIKPRWSLLLLLLLFTASFSPAEIAATAPLGTIVASGYAAIDNATAITGTTIFAGDQVTSKEPALISFINGSRIEMTRATAKFTRNSNALVMDVDQGLIRFSFKKGEEVQINAGQYSFTRVSDIGPSGELGLNRSGQIAMNVMEGAFAVLNTATGMQTEVNADDPFEVLGVSGQGYLSRNGDSLTDLSLFLEPDELKGKCIVVETSAHAIKGNVAIEIMIIGTWDLKTGNYPYKVVECIEEEMIRAGASEEAANNAAVESVFGVPQVPVESHTVRNAAIIAGVSGAIALPLAIKSLRGHSPSPTSDKWHF
jgi:hypothetical protein